MGCCTCFIVRDRDRSLSEACRFVRVDNDGRDDVTIVDVSGDDTYARDLGIGSKYLLILSGRMSSDNFKDLLWIHGMIT